MQLVTNERPRNRFIPSVNFKGTKFYKIFFKYLKKKK